VTIQPRFYQTKTFYGFGIALSGCALYGLWLLRLKRYRREFAVVLGERTRLSREIHDTLLQSLASVAIQLQAVVHELDEGSDNVGESISLIRRRVERYVREAREAIVGLRTPLLRLRDLPRALEEPAKHIVEDFGARVEFVVTGESGTCSPGILEQLLRIAQEAIRNAVRHGKATFVRVELDGTRRSIVLRVVDDGHGFDVRDIGEPPDHCGVTGMRERAERIHGRFSIDSEVKGGTIVKVVVPRTDHGTTS
jgi:signal transduction histidine kinase